MLSTKHGIKQNNKEIQARNTHKARNMLKKALNHVRKMLEWRFRRLGVWMIAKKATSTPLNPKSKVLNQGKEDWVQKQYLVFLVKREKSRDFDVFFWSVFWCLEERKSVERCWAEGPISEKCFSSWLGALYSPGREFQGESPWRFSGLKRSIIWFFLTPLDRYWFSISKKVWNSKIQRSDQKLWLSEVCGAAIGMSSWFSWYLGRSNSDFDP